MEPAPVAPTCASTTWRIPNLVDADGTTGQAYGLQGLPTTFILDAHGKITDVLRGPQTADALLHALHLAAETDS